MPTQDLILMPEIASRHFITAGVLTMERYPHSKRFCCLTRYGIDGDQEITLSFINRATASGANGVSLTHQYAV